MIDPRQRFSNRVGYYHRYRPKYPSETLETLKAELALTPGDIIADIGSGTGILSEMFLNNGNTVYGVEPNPEMRRAAERLLASYPGFISIAGSAEATTLPDSSVKFLTAGQSFHWFDAGRSRIEFARILKPGGWVVLLWNVRDDVSTRFMRDFERLLETHTSDYRPANHQKVGETGLTAFFDRVNKVVYPNDQILDFEGLKGRTLSSSYSPLEGHPQYPSLLAALKRLFEKHHHAGFVKIQYRTEMYYGRLV